MRHPDRAALRIAVGALALVAPFSALAGDAEPGEQDHSSRTCTCPEPRRLPAPGAGYPAANLSLDGLDEIATLNALHVGLTEVPDGANFVWRRSHGRLSGIVRPLFSFRNASGEICRHVVVTLRAGDHIRTVEGAACRRPDGRWVLEG